MLPERIVLLVAHPDDETIAAGAHLKLWSSLSVIHVTDGAPRDGKDASREGFLAWQDYAAERLRELDRAFAAGEALQASRSRFDIADQQVVERLPDVIDKLREIEADIVITHAYEGGHPDHDACAFAAAAIWGGSGRLWEFAGYHNSLQGIESGCFLNGLRGAETTPFPKLDRIGGEDLQRKMRMLSCFQTQRATLRQFRPKQEHFRPAPVYDFDRAPHEGPLLYETWGFAMDGVAWREKVAGVLV